MTARTRSPRGGRGTDGELNDREQRRHELLDAAVAAVRREGPDVSMDAIAKEAGITKPILYSHFGDKAGLGFAIAERFGAALAAQMAERSAQISDPRELMRAAIDLWLSFVEAEPEVYRFLTNGSFLNHDGAAGHRLVAELGAALARVLGGFLRERRVDSGGAEAWAFGIVGMVHLACEWWLDRRTMSRLDLVDYLSELLWGGLAGNGLAAPPSELLSPDESRSTDPHR
ncbi:MAG: TetR family transcriptional regulator [Microthrixaceae bacterium]|nr:TetR family transcriptional regulator [Microthrixaceae bacterium]HMT26086.1 TetR family transcriptional regulator [Microthrixaceae bacterium]HMT61261.1 TetR family transcriptional regulator [Microthrixaceae bacterium]